MTPDPHGENEERKHAAENAPAAMPPKIKAHSYDPCVIACILLARFLGMLQRALGRGQTHLLGAALGLGWKPGPAMIALGIESRQAALAAREILRVGKRRQAKAAKQQRRRHGKRKGRSHA